MRLRIAFLLTLSALVSPLVFSVPANSDEDLTMQAYLGETVFESCGLDKLTADELSRLSSYLAPPEMKSFEVDSALAFMDREGWVPLTLSAGIKEDPEYTFSDFRYLAFTDGRELVLEQRHHETRLPAGHYLAQVGTFYVEILDVYGEEQRLSIVRD